MSADCKNSPELDLLFLVARVHLPAETQSAVQRSPRPTSRLGSLLLLAAHHGLEPLLFHHLHAFAEGVVPATAMQTLRENSKIVAGRNLLLASQAEGDLGASARARD